jgi:hypothetical protein
MVFKLCATNTAGFEPSRALYKQGQKNMPARLNRRRYREIVAALKEVIADKKAPQQRRLRAVETLMEVYARHDRTEAAKEARRKAVDAPEGNGQPEESPEAPGSAQETAEQFLARITGSRTEETER